MKSINKFLVWYSRDGFFQFLFGNIFFDKDQKIVKAAHGHYCWSICVFCTSLAIIFIVILIRKALI